MREVPQPVSDPGMLYVLRQARRSLMGIVAAIDAVLPAADPPPNPPRRLREEGGDRAA